METKYVFRNDYNGNLWELVGEYNPIEEENGDYKDSSQYRYTWAYLSEKQLEKAFREDGYVEGSYCYVMLKGCKVRQI